MVIISSMIPAACEGRPWRLGRRDISGENKVVFFEYQLIFGVSGLLCDSIRL